MTLRATETSLQSPQEAELWNRGSADRVVPPDTGAESDCPPLRRLLERSPLHTCPPTFRQITGLITALFHSIRILRMVTLFHVGVAHIVISDPFKSHAPK